MELGTHENHEIAFATIDMRLKMYKIELSKCESTTDTERATLEFISEL
jgi:hypothetical protein